MIKQVFCQLQVEGTHSWPDCPISEVDYLRDTHRHVFHIKAYRTVTHTDRDVEFIWLKHAIWNYFRGNYFDATKNLCVFGHMSCEMIAEKLIEHFELSACEVSEDGENGCLLIVEDNKNETT